MQSERDRPKILSDRLLVVDAIFDAKTHQVTAKIPIAWLRLTLNGNTDTAGDFDTLWIAGSASRNQVLPVPPPPA